MSAALVDQDIWILVTDTTSYAGNFERPLVAWMTGQYGECEVGEEEAQAAQKQIPRAALRWLREHTVHLPDDNGCRRPASIWPTPGWWNDGSGNHYRDGDPREAGATKYQAFNSTACFFDEEPSATVLRLLATRSRTFPGFGPDTKVEGHRLIARTVAYKERRIE